jgi:hypothetical protein
VHGPNHALCARASGDSCSPNTAVTQESPADGGTVCNGCRNYRRQVYFINVEKLTIVIGIVLLVVFAIVGWNLRQKRSDSEKKGKENEH